MTITSVDSLLQPGRIGPATIPNRIVMPAMTTRNADAEGFARESNETTRRDERTFGSSNEAHEVKLKVTPRSNVLAQARRTRLNAIRSESPAKQFVA